MIPACVCETKRGNPSLTDDADDEPRLRSDEQLSDVEYKPRCGKPTARTRARRVHVLGLAEPPAPLQDGILYPVWPRMGEPRVYVKTTGLAAPIVLVSESSDMLANHEHINIEPLARPRKGVNDVSSSRVAYSRVTMRSACRFQTRCVDTLQLVCLFHEHPRGRPNPQP